MYDLVAVLIIVSRFYRFKNILGDWLEGFRLLKTNNAAMEDAKTCIDVYQH